MYLVNNLIEQLFIPKLKDHKREYSKGENLVRGVGQELTYIILTIISNLSYY